MNWLRKSMWAKVMFCMFQQRKQQWLLVLCFPACISPLEDRFCMCCRQNWHLLLSWRIWCLHENVKTQGVHRINWAARCCQETGHYNDITHQLPALVFPPWQYPRAVVILQASKTCCVRRVILHVAEPQCKPKGTFQTGDEILNYAASDAAVRGRSKFTYKLCTYIKTTLCFRDKCPINPIYFAIYSRRYIRLFYQF